MKYIISESRIIPILKKFIIRSLGEYVEEPSEHRRNLGYQGKFFNDGKVMGEVGSGTFRINVDLYITMSNMFDMNVDDLDPYIIEVVNEVTSPYKVYRVSLGI